MPRFRPSFQSNANSASRDSYAADPPLSRLQVFALAAICGAFGLIAWFFYIWVFHGDPGQDWMVFYTAVRAYFDGNLPLLFDGEALTAALNQRFASWLSFTLNPHPWVYPPTFLLLLLPFGLLPPVASLAIFLLSGFVVLLAATASYAGHGQPRWIVAFSLVLCPAVPFNVMTGQNAFFTSALLVGGCGLLGRYPVIAGVLFGVLAFKPQLWLMVPVALLAARHWRALWSTGASALALALLTLPLFGVEAWRAWLELVTGLNPAYSAWVTNGRLNGLSVFACVTWLGAPHAVASLAQALAIALAAAIVYRVFRRPVLGPLHLAALLTATMLAAPHASASDAVLLALATSLFVVAPHRERLPAGQLILAAAVWISPLFNPPSLFRPGSLTPVLLLLLLAAIVSRLGKPGVPAEPAAADLSVALPDPMLSNRAEPQ